MTTEEVVEFIIRYFFSIFLTVGYTFTAGSSAVVPMTEKKGGLRHMMHLNGLNSTQYWIGMKTADIIIALFPATITCILLWLTFDIIMGPEYVWEFFFVFMFFANAMDCISYLLSHLFSDPETAVKYVSLVSSLGLLFGPLIGFSIIGTMIDSDEGVVGSLQTLYFISPLFTFWMTTQNLSYAGNEDREKANF